MGPTGTGKTDLAIAIAQQVPSYLISVDSALVYRGMDIGTAKPDGDTLARYPHALVDICDPAEPYSVARFLKDAQQQLDLALERGLLPLFVGGTMLYFKALRDGLSRLPAADAGLRAELEARSAEQGWPALHAELERVDPDTAGRLHPNHSARILRALEVWRLTGVPLSEWHSQGNQGGLYARVLPVQIGLIPSRREPLHQRLDQRLGHILEAGLVEEVQLLFERGDLHPNLPSMRSVGYRQTWEFLAGAISAQEMRQRILVATRQLAKRQNTWLNGWPDLQVLDPLAAGGGWRNTADLARDCLKFL